MPSWIHEESNAFQMQNKTEMLLFTNQRRDAFDGAYAEIQEKRLSNLQWCCFYDLFSCQDVIIVRILS